MPPWLHAKCRGAARIVLAQQPTPLPACQHKRVPQPTPLPACQHECLCILQVFCSRIGSLRKALRSRAEFVCIDAPYPSEPEGQQSVDDSDGTAGSLGRSWW